MEEHLPALNDRVAFRDDLRIGDLVYVRRARPGLIEVFKLETWQSPDTCEFPVLELVAGDKPNTARLRPIPPK